MNEEIRKYLDSANFKFKDVDKNGVEVELTLSEVIDNLIENNKKLIDYINRLQNENEKLKAEINLLTKKEIIDFGKNAKQIKLKALDQKRYKSRCKKAIKNIKNIFEDEKWYENYDYNDLENVLKNVLNILQGSVKE